MDTAVQVSISNDIFKYAEKLKMLKELKEETEKKLKSINAEIELVNQELVGLMTEHEVQNFVLGGNMFYLHTNIYANAIPDKKHELYQELKNNGYSELVVETVNHKTLSAFVRELLEESDELPAWIADKINVFEKTSINIRKAK